MPIIDSSTLVQGEDHPDNDYIYNCLDTCITLECFEEISTLYNTPPDIYNFSRALQAPVLEMMCRGFRIDEYERQKGISELREAIAKLNHGLQRMAHAVWDQELNPRSPKQLQQFFYQSMHLPEIWSSSKGVRKLSMNIETLEKLEVYLHARPIIASILSIRDLSKTLRVLETEVDSDGRMRTSYNIGGTESGRFSSSANAFGTGTNLQNLKQDPDWSVLDSKYKISLRKIFIADPGYKICGIDLEQAESREVGWLLGILFDDWTYLDACEAGDLHTVTCKLIWRDLGWTGDAKHDREIADRNFYRQFSYRDLSKRGGHGCLPIGHEVLTRNGWVDISMKPNEIMMWSRTASKFGQVTNWEDKEYTGNFMNLQGTSIDITMTEDHRVVYYKDKRFSEHVINAGDMPYKGVIPLGNNYQGGTDLISVAMARIVAAYQCDGHQKSTNRVEFHFHKERKFERLEILAKAANIIYERRGDKAFLHLDMQIAKHAGAYLLNWNKLALEAYIQEHKYWDGHASETAVSLHSATRDHLDWLQTIGRLLGIGGNFQKTRISGFGTTMHTLQQNNRLFADIGSLKIRNKTSATHRVYCPTVETGFFYVRRNGKISITGNSNYLGTPFTMSRHLKVPPKLMENFQSEYFRAYPIPRWHTWTAGQIQTIQQLTTPFGRRRHFFGRPNDDTTLREAVAYGPQSATADRMNLALWRIWKYMGTRIQLLAQVHDAVYFQYPENMDPQPLIAEAISLLSTPFTHTRPNGQQRVFDVPGEAKVGWNWGNYHEMHNPDGLRKFKGEDTRKRSGTGKDRVM